MIEEKKTRIADNILTNIKAEPSAVRHYMAMYAVCEDMENSPAKWRYTGELKRYCAELLTHNNSAEIMQLFRAVLLMEAKGLRFDSYMQYIELLREPEKRFWIPRRNQLYGVASAVQDLVDDKLDILSISLPPGTGKSTLEIFLHSMMIGAFPDNCSLASGHSGTLTGSIYDGVLEIINDPEYLWKDVYPTAGDIITNAKEQTIDIGKRHRFSSLTCRAIGADRKSVV